MSGIQQNKNSNSNNFFSQFDPKSNKTISVELCPNRKLDRKALKSLHDGNSLTFYSITWHVNPDLDEISQISSINLARELKSDGLNVLVHLSCGYLDKSQALNVLGEFKRLDLNNIFVVQGDLQPGCPFKGDFKYASDFIRFIRQNFGSYFNIGVAAYVDCHPNSANKLQDLQYLKIKVDAGADFIITQMIFDCHAFSSFVEQCKLVGISVPFILGLYVINSYDEFASMSKFCQVTVPQDIVDVVTKNKDHPEEIEKYGIRKCLELMHTVMYLQPCVKGVHIFSLNNIELVSKFLSSCQLCGGLDAGR